MINYSLINMNSESQPVVSVVTPVYNGGEYLAECIESVLGQTYQNWEYCIVNNCSTDRTLEIAKAYAKKDKRIRIHNNSEFVGCDENGNIAFQQISPGSKYCKVVQADDWMFPECLMEMVKLAEAHPTIAIVSSYRLTNIRITVQALPYTSRVISGRDICRMTLLGLPSVFGSPSAMLIHADEVRKRPHFYNVANPHCDMEVCLDILRERDFGFVHQMLTFERSHPQSESSRGSRYGFTPFGRFEHVTKYGQEYLSEKELTVMLKRRRDEYYAFLGDRVFRNKENGFWEYQKTALGRIGQSLNMARVIRAVILEVLDVILNPLHTFKRIAGKLSHSAEGVPKPRLENNGHGKSS
ncbi:Glycosyltransferase [Candidatus Nitrospira nitrosa]|uniref:Glycosyltransferase n=1 Tax=Candidatus Nitrospira nitrosa TaxID=1742972 RepID=A0A0S4LB56_9BACT|nr:glycosyltransferase family A protein [Candidatus Nitrospira nitrosa]CUS34899.1 Glycosyltransferase [Candidatus Nitrospira nitrosa]